LDINVEVELRDACIWSEIYLELPVYLSAKAQSVIEDVGQRPVTVRCCRWWPRTSTSWWKRPVIFPFVAEDSDNLVKSRGVVRVIVAFKVETT